MVVRNARHLFLIILISVCVSFNSLKIYSLKFSDIWQKFYFYRILNNENFKTEVEQTNFVTHLIITVQLYY